MITCELMGGLGNQIFQIFATIAHARKCNTHFYFLNVEKLGNRNTFWNTFFHKLKNYLLPSFPSLHIYDEKMFSYNDIPTHTQDTKLFGYFQSDKYFKNYYSEIYKLIGIEDMKTALKIKVDLNTISMHFRIGDYKYIQQCHPIVSYSYYEKALKHIQSIYSTSFTVIYFCEDEDIDNVEEIIHKLKQKFSYNFIRGDNILQDWEQMLYMSLCEHNIIANSSFSWWGAYFNTNKDKIVCYPSVWFGPQLPNNTCDLFPDGWIKIQY
jgi:hypothetical protein